MTFNANNLDGQPHSVFEKAGLCTIEGARYLEDERCQDERPRLKLTSLLSPPGQGLDTLMPLRCRDSENANTPARFCVQESTIVRAAREDGSPLGKLREMEVNADLLVVVDAQAVKSELVHGRYEDVLALKSLPRSALG
uniref:Uncharacterized protein n=1 Tax=Moniliophthora roreri TaxID=221103 RepID=A0A0W0G517_MONRR